MEKRSIIHMLDPTPHNSPFDINMAVDAGFDVIAPYINVKLENVAGLTQDAIFSRGPKGVQRTSIYIGGRDLRLALDMLNAAKQAMVPPFEVSVFADPSGAFTTAAGLVACVEKGLKDTHNKTLKNCQSYVFGGTGPVGIATGIIAAQAGAHVSLVDHLSAATAKDVAEEYNRIFDIEMQGVLGSSSEDKINLIRQADIIFCTAKAGIQVIDRTVLAQAEQLKVAGDVNAVPPAGIEGIKLKDFGEPLLHAIQANNAIGVGALAVGDIKYKLQKLLLQSMLETEKPMYLDFRDAFLKAREIV